MFQSFLKVAIRNIVRQKAYALINILGLSIGIACSILITLFIIYENSFDKFHEKSDRIARVTIDGQFADTKLLGAYTAVPTGPAFFEEIPEVVNFTRIEIWDNVIIQQGDRTFLENDFFWADSGFFEIFSFPLISGNPSTVLDEPRTMVLSEKMAKKYFGDENPMGRVLSVFGDSTSYRITGVMKDIPDNSHMYCDFVVDFQSIWRANQTQWTSNNIFTYLLLDEAMSPEDLNAKFDPVVRKYVGPEIMQYIGISLEDWEASGNFYSLKAQPLADIHFNTDIEHGMRPSSDKKYVYIFSMIALFIILIACINFMNLSTARSAGRAREVGLRKVMGSGRGQLVWQFLAESFFMVLIALILALLLIELILPVFHSQIHVNLTLEYFSNWYTIPVLLCFAVFVGLLAGSYPAFFLASFRPVAVMTGKLKAGTKSSRLRSVLVVFQFVISIFIILGTLVISRQLNYLVNKELGFDKEQLVVLERFGTVGRDRVETFKQEIAKIPGVITSSSSTMVPGHPNNYNAFMMEGKPPDQTFLLEVNYADQDYPETYGLSIIDGRFLSNEFASDSSNIVINEAAVRNFGIAEPMKTNFVQPGEEGLEVNRMPVVGVMNDFHNASLHTEIRPYMIRTRSADWDWIPYLTIRLEPQNMQGTIKQVENTWAEFTNDSPFQYFFLDDDFASRYEQEKRTRIIFLVFSILAIFVASLGLLGLSAFTTEQRTREIGIRKAMGANASQVVRLISRETIILVGIATILAWPVSYYFTKNWLMDFAYRIELGFAPFLLSFAFAMVISLVTISFQTITAALRNPADALRYE
ncbi:ABC transporter permease [Bacteroidota bacterium]